MSPLEGNATPRSRARLFLRRQLPFVVGFAVVIAALLLAMPDELTTPPMLGACALTLASTVAAIAVPWERFATPWMMSLAITDMIAAALVRYELIGVLPGAGMIAIFPVLWLAYAFGTSGIVVAIAGTVFATSLPFVVRRHWPASAGEWVNVTTLPLLIVVVAGVVHLAARRLQRSTRLADAATERLKRTLTQTLDQSILMRSILDTVDAGVVYFDDQRRLVMSNSRAQHLSSQYVISLPEHGLVAEAAHDTLVYGPDRETPVPPWRRLVTRALNGEDFTDEVEWLGPPDAQIAVMVSSRRVRRDDGQVIGTVVIAHDITELAHALEVSEDFLKTVSHELRTPITNIAGFTDLIEEGLDDHQAELRAHLATVQRNTQRLTDRVRELVTAAADAEPLQLDTVDVGALVDEAVDDARADAERRGITLEHLTAAPAHGRVDSERLRHAIRELIANAIKFGPAHSAVTVGQHVVGDRVHVSVSDRGPGLSHAEQARIFDRFYRTAYARRNAVQGFGIGLTLVRDIVAAHGGRLHIDCPPEGGSRFTIDLPRRLGTDELPARPAENGTLSPV